MKKLKYLLIIFILLFFVNVRKIYALDYFNFSYNSGFNTYLSFTAEEKEDFISMLENISSFDNNDTYYYKTIKVAGNTITLRKVTSSNPFVLTPMTMKRNIGVKYFSIFAYDINGGQRQDITYSCNSSLTSCSLSSKGNVSDFTYDNFVTSQSDSSLNRYIYETNQDEWDYLTSPVNYGSGYDFASEFDIINSYSVNNGTVYEAGDTLSSSNLIGDFYPVQQNNEVSISYETWQENGYVVLRIMANNYTPTTVEYYNVILQNMNTGNLQFPPLQPQPDGTPAMVLEVYEPTTYRYYVEDIETHEVTSELIITIDSINYSDIGVNIENIDKTNKTVTYKYYNNGTQTGFVCKHQIAGENEIEDVGCFTNTFTLMNFGNKSVTFRIYLNNQIQYESTIPFVFSQGQPYITFKEEYENGIINLKVILNNYNTNYVTKYSINGSEFITSYPTFEINDRYYFIVWNLTENTNIVVNMYDQNNNLIANSYYNYNYIKGITIQKENYEGIKGFFDKININNISNDLKQIINYFGNILMGTQLGNLFIIMATITILGYIVYLIRR